MEKKPKPEEKIGEKDKEKKQPPREPGKKSYYYDDAHGYEIYNPDEDDEKDEN